MPRRPEAGGASWRRAAVALALLAACPAAWAHGSATGMAGFAAGFVHPLLEPAHLVALITLVLLIGQHGERARLAPLGIVAGSALGLIAVALGHPAATDVPLLAGAALAGIAVAVARPLPAWVGTGVAAALGFGIGLASRPDAPAGAPVFSTLIGTWAGCSTWTVIGSNAVAALSHPWARVLVRVAASWMAACALLFLALAMAPRPAPPAVGAPGTLDVGR